MPEDLLTFSNLFLEEECPEEDLSAHENPVRFVEVTSRQISEYLLRMPFLDAKKNLKSQNPMYANNVTAKARSPEAVS